MAAEARAAAKHSANPCFVKEDAGRASRFSGFPSSSSTRSRLDSDGAPHSAVSGPVEATPLSVPDNQKLHTHNSRWWFRSRGHIGNQKDFMFASINAPEIGPRVPDAGFFYGSPKIREDHSFDESSHCLTHGVCEKGYAECVKSDQDVRNEESNPEKANNKNMGEYWYMDDHLTGLEQNCLSSTQPKTLCSDFESLLVQAQKAEPWWRMTDKDDLASMIAQKSLEHIENCDLPRPQTKDFRMGQLPSLESFRYYKTLPSTMQMGFSDLSNHHWERTTAHSLVENQCLLSETQNSLANSDSLLSYKDSSTTKGDHELTQTFPGNDPTKAELLEALCHSQKRAREGEQAAQKAYNEKEHMVTLFFRQASHLFAYKQWLYLLQLENFFLQLSYKNQPISTLFPAGLWVPYKGMQMKKARHKVVKPKQSSTNSGTGISSTAFLLGLSLAGAGLLLGWTMGWLFPSS